MLPKPFIRVSILILTLMVLLAIPISAQAGGVCGGTYIVEQGDTLDKIAAMCGITTNAIIAANPGTGTSLYIGQILTLPGSSPIPPTAVPTFVSTIPAVTNNYYTTNNYNNFNYYNYYNTYSGSPTINYDGTYTVQYGDTFSGIASRFGISIYDLWAVNPYIWNINYLYAGQVINLPASAKQATYPPPAQPWAVIVPTATQTPPSSLSYGTAPYGADYGSVALTNRANADVYVSLQGSTRDGNPLIREYSVNKGSLKVQIPTGWYDYVAWVGGQKFTGGFHLGGSSDPVITFFINKVVVE